MTNWNERNRSVIEEFRSSKGYSVGSLHPRPLLLLTTYGRKTGQAHTTPLMYLPDGDRWIVFASKGGAPKNPDWYHNLVANTTVTVEVGAETFEADAMVVSGQEREQLYARQVRLYPMFADYENKTTRKIPVVALTRKS
jgi:deazaflavin-dependent oxidoreductase (nitroreductase family)